MRMPGYPSGVPSQYKVHVHPYPTRFHGPLYQRPVFGFPWMASPQNVFKPGDFYAQDGVGNITLDERTQGLINGLLIGAVVGAAIMYYVRSA